MSDLWAHLLLALALFFFTNWLGRRAIGFGYFQISLYNKADDAPAFNLIYRIITPQVFLVLAAAALALLNAPIDLAELWRVPLYSFIGRWAFNLLMGRRRLIDWRRQLGVATLATALSYWLATNVLIDAARFLPDPTDLRNELWLVVILFLYQAFNQMQAGSDSSATRREAYIHSSYNQLHERFRGIVAESTADHRVESLIYAVMMVETFNRPRIYRLIERHILFPLGLAKSLGPMQVIAESAVSDAESVRRGAQLLATNWDSIIMNARASGEYQGDELQSWDAYATARKVAVKYNPSGAYADEVVSLYDAILSRYYPESAN